MNSDHSCDENCQECRELQPGQLELTIATYGYEQNGVLLSRRAAEKIGDNLLFDFQEAKNDPASKKWQDTKAICLRLEDDTPDGTKGRVIAICEPVSQPYKPGMEYK